MAGDDIEMHFRIEKVPKTCIESKSDKNNTKDDNESDNAKDGDNSDSGKDDSINDQTKNSGNRDNSNTSSRKREDFLSCLERVKQDILHIFLRFQRVLSKEHGCYEMFMADLRDAFFIPNEADMDFIREMLQTAGMSEKEIDKKSQNDYKYFLRRVRRHVPQNRELRKRFMAVADLYRDVVDAKTGQVFFGPKGLKEYKSVLKHIEKNCLSDIPKIHYYIQVGINSKGIPILKCI
jgi:hypothetical protein